MSDSPERTRPSAQIAPAETPNLAHLMTLATGVIIVTGLYLGREVLVPITVAVLLSFILAPLAGLLRRARLGRVPSVLLAVLLALGVILALAALIGSQIADLADDIPEYQYTIDQKVESVRGFVSKRVEGFVNEVGQQFEHHAPPQTQPAATATKPEPAPVPVEIHQPPPSGLALARRFLMPVASPLAALGIIIIVSIFILLHQEDLRDRMIRLFGAADLHRTTAAMDDAARRLSRYFLTQLGLNASFGVVIGFGLMVIGVPSPALWGVVAALMRFVPYIGSFLSALLPMTLAAAVDPGWSALLWTAALFIVTETFVGQFAEPMIYGHSTGLSPVAVVIAAIFWTWLWGSVGLILSTPLTVCLVVLGRHIKRLEFLDVLLGDQPALTPVESFYQRMLADDTDEVQAFAEQYLREHALSAYYDDVALKGLQLAAFDVARGVLTPAQVGTLVDAVRDLAAELDEFEDTDPETETSGSVRAPPPGERPPAWRHDVPVLCAGGRGPLDDAAAIMLVQLLAKHGIGARMATHREAGRGRIGDLDSTGIAMVCVSHLEGGASPAQLRYLIRRLRRHFPGARLLLGLWPSESPLERVAELREAIDADDYATSLRETVATCLRAAGAAPSISETEPARSPTAAPSTDSPTDRPIGSELAARAGVAERQWRAS